MRFREGREPEADLAAALPAFLSREQILVTKETKKGKREVDIRPGIFQLAVCMEDFCMEEGQTGGRMVIRMLVYASSSGNIKPVQVIEAMLAEQGESLQENALMITREEVYAEMPSSRDAAASERILVTSERVLVPLDAVGTGHSVEEGHSMEEGHSVEESHSPEEEYSLYGKGD